MTYSTLWSLFIPWMLPQRRKVKFLTTSSALGKYKLVPFCQDVTSYPKHYCVEELFTRYYKGIMCLLCIELSAVSNDCRGWTGTNLYQNIG